MAISAAGSRCRSAPTLLLEGLDEDYWLEEPVPYKSPPPPPHPGSQALAAIESWMRASESSPPPAFRYAGHELIYVLRPPRAGVNVAVVGVMARTRKKDGQWAKAKPAVLALNDVARATEPDRSILAALVGAPRSAYSYSAYYAEVPAEATFALGGNIPVDLVRAILQTGRAFLDTQSPMTAPYRWDDGPVWQFEPVLTRAAAGWRLDGRLVRPTGEILPIADTVVIDAQFVWTHTALARADGRAFLPLIAEIRRQQALEILERDTPRLALLLAQLGVPPASLPAELRIQRLTDAVPLPCLRVTRPSPASQTLIAEVVFDYDGTVLPHATTPTSYDSARQRLIVRRPELETTAVERALEAGVRRGWDGYQRRERLELTPRDLPRVVSALAGEGWRVEADGRLFRTPTGVRLSVSSGIDWFDLDAAVDFGEASAPLTDVIAAFNRRDRVVRLGDGSTGLLPEEWLRRYLPLAAAGEAIGDRVRFRQPQTALLDALLEDAAAHATVDVDDAFGRAREELVPRGPDRARRPARRFHRHAARLSAGRPRVAAVSSAVRLRRVSRGRHGAGQDDHGAGAARCAPRRAGSRGASLDRRDAAKPRAQLAERSGAVCAGASCRRLLVGRPRQRRRPARRRCPADHLRNAPPGRPEVEGHRGRLRHPRRGPGHQEREHRVRESGAAPQRASSAGTDRHADREPPRRAVEPVRVPESRHSRAIEPVWRAAAGTTDPETISLLARGLRPFILRRTKQEVARELPARTEQTLLCELSKPERALYERLRQHYRASVLARVARDGVTGARMHILEALLRLRQAACHPALVEPAKSHPTSAKLEMLAGRVQEVLAEDHKALIFSQFTTLLGLVREELDRQGVTYAYLDGRTRDRARVVRQFQEDPNCRLFLISLKAGGVGLNLTAAEYVFLLDPWWNPAVEAQAIDRTHRIGQTREVFAYRIVADDTIESKILELQQSKRALADAVLGASAGGLKGLRREDLEMLLS